MRKKIFYISDWLFYEIYTNTSLKKKAEDVAPILIDKCMMTFGLPESILSDGGTQYKSKLKLDWKLFMNIKTFKD